MFVPICTEFPYNYNAIVLIGLARVQAQLASPLNKKVILVKRFDRVVSKTSVYRRHMISAMTLLNLDEYEVRRGYSSYLDLADLLRKYARNFGDDGAELFRRMVFNILIGNTDDHARNHACFWDGEFLDLTPTYDVCPQPRAGLSADQAMEVDEWGRKSNLQNAISYCEWFGLLVGEADEIIREMVEIVEGSWRQVFANAGVPDGHLDFLSTSTIASESVFYELE